MNTFRKLTAAAVMALSLTTIVAAPLLLTGCPQLGLVRPQGFEASLTAAYQSVTTGANLVGSALDAGKISAADARNAHTTLTNLKEGLDIADQIHATDATAGEQRLKATIAGIDALIAYLGSKA